MNLHFHEMESFIGRGLSIRMYFSPCPVPYFSLIVLNSLAIVDDLLSSLSEIMLAHTSFPIKYHIFLIFLQHVLLFLL